MLEAATSYDKKAWRPEAKKPLCLALNEGAPCYRFRHSGRMSFQSEFLAGFVTVGVVRRLVMVEVVKLQGMAFMIFLGLDLGAGVISGRF